MTDLEQQLEAPLALLKSLADEALESDPDLLSEQLQEKLLQIQASVGDVLDTAAVSLTELLEQVGADMLSSSPAADQMQAELKEVSVELEDQLGLLSDLLHGASSLEELGETQEEIRGVELAMQLTLSRLGSLFDVLETPPQALSEDSKTEEAANVLELLSLALESVDRHLLDGDLRHFREALVHIEQAGGVLHQALSGEMRR